MNARIGSPCPPQTVDYGAERLASRLDRFLDRQAVRLFLPTDESRSVIFDGQLVTGHDGSVQSIRDPAGIRVPRRKSAAASGALPAR